MTKRVDVQVTYERTKEQRKCPERGQTLEGIDHSSLTKEAEYVTIQN